MARKSLKIPSINELFSGKLDQEVWMDEEQQLLVE